MSADRQAMREGEGDVFRVQVFPLLLLLPSGSPTPYHLLAAALYYYFDYAVSSKSSAFSPSSWSFARARRAPLRVYPRRFFPIVNTLWES